MTEDGLHLEVASPHTGCCQPQLLEDGLDDLRVFVGDVVEFPGVLVNVVQLDRLIAREEFKVLGGIVHWRHLVILQVPVILLQVHNIIVLDQLDLELLPLDLILEFPVGPGPEPLALVVVAPEQFVCPQSVPGLHRSSVRSVTQNNSHLEGNCLYVVNKLAPHRLPLIEDEIFLILAVQVELSDPLLGHPRNGGQCGGPVHDMEQAVQEVPLPPLQEGRVEEGDGPGASLPESALGPPERGVGGGVANTAAVVRSED